MCYLRYIHHMLILWNNCFYVSKFHFQVGLPHAALENICFVFSNERMKFRFCTPSSHLIGFEMYTSTFNSFNGNDFESLITLMLLIDESGFLMVFSSTLLSKTLKWCERTQLTYWFKHVTLKESLQTLFNWWFLFAHRSVWIASVNILTMLRHYFTYRSSQRFSVHLRVFH